MAIVIYSLFGLYNKTQREREREGETDRQTDSDKHR